MIASQQMLRELFPAVHAKVVIAKKQLAVGQGRNTVRTVVIARRSANCNDGINRDLRTSPGKLIDSPAESEHGITRIPRHHLLGLQHNGLLPRYPAQRLASDVKPQDQGRHKCVTPHQDTVPDGNLPGDILPEIRRFQKYEAARCSRLNQLGFMLEKDLHRRS